MLCLMWLIYLINRVYLQVSSEAFSSNETHSLLLYQPEDDRDFGYLYCWATNVLGSMEQPCAFQLIPAGKQIG